MAETVETEDYILLKTPLEELKYDRELSWKSLAEILGWGRRRAQSVAEGKRIPSEAELTYIELRTNGCVAAAVWQSFPKKKKLKKNMKTVSARKTKFAARPRAEKPSIAYLYADQQAALQSISADRDLSISALLRLALDVYLSNRTLGEIGASGLDANTPQDAPEEEKVSARVVPDMDEGFEVPLPENMEFDARPLVTDEWITQRIAEEEVLLGGTDSEDDLRAKFEDWKNTDDI